MPAPDPADLADGQVIVATRAGGICGSDLPRFLGRPYVQPGDLGGTATRAPGFPMHEIVGKIITSRHPDHRVGDLVVGWASSYLGLAELVVGDGDELATFDSALTDTTAVMLQSLACVLYAVEQLGDIEGQRVAVVGQGPIGLLFSHVLSARGASHVVGVDLVDRTQVAELFGVNETVTAHSTLWSARLPATDRPQVIVEAVGHQVSTLQDCVQAAAVGGQISYFGVPDDPTYPLQMRAFQLKNLTLRSGVTRERRRVLADAGRYLTDHPELAESYVSHIFTLNDVQAAYTAATRPRVGQHKIVVRTV
ncbi:MAG TPA: zinc-binding dehydrogenase [Microlunatus sp.]